MSRSFRKTPIFGVASSKSSKQWKRSSNRRFRRINNILTYKIKNDNEKYFEKTFKILDEIANLWDAPQDGRYYWGLQETTKIGIYENYLILKKYLNKELVLKEKIEQWNKLMRK